MHQAAILPGRIQIVDENPHAHAAFRRGADVLQEDTRRLVLGDQVVL